MSGTKRRGRLVAGLLGIALATWYLYLSSKLPMGRTDRPGAGVYPVVVGVFAILVSLLLVLESLFSEQVSGHIRFPRSRGLRLLMIFVGATALLILTLPYVGIYLGAFAYVLVMAKTLGAKGWLRPVAYCLVTTVVISWTFLDLFNVPLAGWPSQL